MQLKISSFAITRADESLEAVLRALSTLRQRFSFHYDLTCAPAALPDIMERARAHGIADRLSASVINLDEEFEERIAATDIALQLHERNENEISDTLRRIMAAGVPVFVPNINPLSELPDDVVVKIDVDEYRDALLQAFLERLIADAPLRKRIGVNARLYASSQNGSLKKDEETNNQPSTDAALSASRRFQKIEGMDWKRGAIEYPRRLDESNRYHLFTKPFYNLANKISRWQGEGLDEDTYRHFCDFANLAMTFALPAGATILDVGCGSGWLSEYFARLGYDVTGIDISPDLIEMARERLSRVPYGVDHQTPLKYRFITHDVEGLPLAETFDAVICYDSLHHFEDERAVVRNLAAMLRYGGLLFVMEGERPPAGSQTEEELRDVMLTFETLESPFTRDYLRALLREQGFAVTGDYVSVNGLFEREMMEGERLRVEPAAVNYLLCKKVGKTNEAASLPDTRQPDRLCARISLSGEWPERFAPRAPLRVSFEIENAGNTLWLTSRAALKGTVRLGIKIINEAGEVVEEFHGEPPLPNAIAPGERVKLTLERHAPQTPGSYTLKIDLVNQDICWFEQQGSEPLILPFHIL
ncbi:MAG: methyltransferase domain-containing protein [Pyrinomonadaceae bacterium]